jgi:hypothetical protein
MAQLICESTNVFRTVLCVSTFGWNGNWVVVASGRWNYWTAMVKVMVGV